MIELDHLTPDQDRAAKIRAAFETAGTPALSPVRDLLGDGFSYEEISPRGVQAWLEPSHPYGDLL